ncbi:PDZ domain-containing protein [Acidobacteria bacterium AH-259-D05]|nr:PDZ domain-containing protein [Acidobacteria bacterium AH-259-D05]
MSWRLEVPTFWNRNKKPEEQVKVYRTILPPHLHLGLVVDPLTPKLTKYLRHPEHQGLLIRFVLPDSPAGKAGFQAGDVLTQVNGRSVSSPLDIKESLKAVEDGVMVIQFLRNGRPMTTKVILP